MKLSLIFVVILSRLSQPDDLESVRAGYHLLPKDKALCRIMLAQMAEKIDHSATHLAYYGGLQAIWAGHASNPMSKLNSFIDGKKNIEQAVRKEPDNLEIRFIRLSIQKNAPVLLAYNSSIEEDTEFLQNRMDQLKSKILINNIKTLITD